MTANKSHVKRCLAPILSLFILLLVPAVWTGALGSSTDNVSLNTTLSYLERTVTALKSALQFFHTQYNNVNLDAVIGTRIVEGTLTVLLQNLDQQGQSELLQADILSSIRELYHLAKTVSDAAEPSVATSEQLYYQRIGPTITEGMWDLDYPRRLVPRSVPLWNYSDFEAMTEEESDDCLTELFGTGRRTAEQCAISEKCWTRMTKMEYNQYSLSHEIFYLQLAELADCLPQMMWKILMHEQPSLHRMQDIFCANMLKEAKHIARAGYPARHQDLFMEQAALCGMYGYWEFFRYDWLDQMLGWQDQKNGCYRWAGWPLEKYAPQLHLLRKREERRLDDGCLCHRTTVAAGALVQYVRYLTETFVNGKSLILDAHH